MASNWMVRLTALTLLLAVGCASEDTLLRDQGAQDAGARDIAVADMNVVDQGADLLAACLAGATQEAGIAYLSRNTFTTSDGSIRLGFVIQPDPDLLGTSGTTAFEAVRVAAVIDGTVHCLTDVSSVNYQVSHHNFDDTLSVTIDGTVYTWVVDIEGYESGPPVFSLTVEPAFGPARMLPLTSTGCSTTPTTMRCFGSAPW